MSMKQETEAINRQTAQIRRIRESIEKVQLVCNECGRKRLVSADGNYHERCPRCGGVDWDVLG